MKTIVYVGEERNVATGRHRPIHKLSRALFSAHRNNKRRRRGRKQRRTYYYYNIASFHALAHRPLIILYALPPPPLRTAAARFPGITSPVFSLSPSLSLALSPPRRRRGEIPRAKYATAECAACNNLKYRCGVWIELSLFSGVDWD